MLRTPIAPAQPRTAEIGIDDLRVLVHDHQRLEPLELVRLLEQEVVVAEDRRVAEAR